MGSVKKKSKNGKCVRVCGIFWFRVCVCVGGGVVIFSPPNFYLLVFLFYMW